MDLWKKPARYSHANTSMDALVDVPQYILDGLHTHAVQLFAEELVGALNCCRKYGKGMLVIAQDENSEYHVVIKHKGRLRWFKALFALEQWIQVDEAFSLLANKAGMAVSLESLTVYRNMKVF